MPARPFRMLDKVLRLTPREFATFVMVIFSGSRQSVLSTSPGCGGLCIFILALMVVLIVNMVGVLTGENKSDSPIAAYLHRPGTLSGATKLVEIQAWQIHITCAG